MLPYHRPWQLLGIPVESISACDLKQISWEVVRRNFPNLKHFFDSLDGQITSAGCNVHPGLDAVGCIQADSPDLGVIGTPCQPYSRQRVKRHHPNSVREHRGYDATFTDLVLWLQTFEPKAGFAEQVEGFDLPESSASGDKTTPMQQILVSSCSLCIKHPLLYSSFILIPGTPT